MHAETWILVGALIVFATFVFRDGFREYLKDISDSLTAAENLYAIQDNDILVQNIAALQEQVSVLSDKIDGKNVPSQNDYPAVVTRDSQRLKDLIMHLQIMFQRASRLVDKLPSNQKPIRKQRDELRAKIERMTAEIKNRAVDPDPHKQLILQKVEIMKVATLQIEALVFTDGVLDTTRRIQFAAESLYGYCKRVSYLLYTLGWGLALFGRLRGGFTLQ